MFGFKKDKAAQSSAEKPTDPSAPGADTENTGEGFFGRLKNGLSKTRNRLNEGLQSLVLGEKTVDEDLLEDVETQLLSADVGIEATDQIISNLKAKLNRKQLGDSETFMASLRAELETILQDCTAPLSIPEQSGPFVILVVGVNGVGKTTTIGKLSKRLQAEGKSVLLAAGDTFRAAAVEQLQAWGERNNIPVIAQDTGSDSASVIFDAMQAARARDIDVLIADTAGRLHTKDNLMHELEKIVRVLRKQDPALPHEVMLVLDATTGQNALSQAQSFHASTQLTGITLTKLDGTAKGGIVFALAKKFGLPIRFIGIGEQAEDLRPFDAHQFIEALFAD